MFEKKRIQARHPGLDQQKHESDDHRPAEADYDYRARVFPDVGEPTLKGIQLAIDELVNENPKAKKFTTQQVIDLSFLP